VPITIPLPLQCPTGPFGEIDSVTLAKPAKARLFQLQDIVGGFIEAVALPQGRYMVINENGKDGPHAVNHIATAIAHEAEAIMPIDYITGVAVLVQQETGLSD